MIFSIITGFILGIWLGSILHITLATLLALLILGVIIFFYKHFTEESLQKYLLWSVIFFLGVFLGGARIYFSDLYRPSKLSQFENKSVIAVATVVSEPDVREKSVMLTVKTDSVTLASTTFPIKEKIILSTSLYPELYYGDEVSFKTVLKEPSNIESDSGRSFDYGGYLRVRGIWYTAGYTNI